MPPYLDWTGLDSAKPMMGSVAGQPRNKGQWTSGKWDDEFLWQGIPSSSNCHEPEVGVENSPLFDILPLNDLGPACVNRRTKTWRTSTWWSSFSRGYLTESAPLSSFSTSTTPAWTSTPRTCSDSLNVSWALSSGNTSSLSLHMWMRTRGIIWRTTLRPCQIPLMVLSVSWTNGSSYPTSLPWYSCPTVILAQVCTHAIASWSSMRPLSR